MAFTKYVYTPTDGFKNTSSFPNPTTGAVNRAQRQALHDQTRDAVHDLIDEMAAVTDGDSGGDNIGMTPIPALGSASTSQSQMEAMVALFSFPWATTASLTYYVDVASGSDSNNGLTVGTPFKTIGKAISLLPPRIDHTVVINVAVGDYSGEGVLTVSGYTGKGSITINGDTVVSTSYSILRLNKNRNGIPVTLRGFNFTTSTNVSVVANQCITSIVNLCNFVVSNSNQAISSVGSTLTVSNSTISNHSVAIDADTSTVYSNTNSGTGNTIGLRSSSASTIGKNGTQPGATTAEVQQTGGVIR